jgi:hypothetical protein
MHIYAFGSICRGEISEGSDIDVLIVVSDYDSRLDPDDFSIYSYRRILELWREGNPFAWHLHLESRLIHTSDKTDFLKGLGEPAAYHQCIRDCEKFLGVFEDARRALTADTTNPIFELSTIFLAVRNIATCFSLGCTCTPDFSRQSASRLINPLAIARPCYATLERARILATRGKGEPIACADINLVVDSLGEIEDWMHRLVFQAREYERV